MKHHRHPELVSASMPLRFSPTRNIQHDLASEAWTLKQVQGDLYGGQYGAL
jgi:hypothetical protein